MHLRHHQAVAPRILTVRCRLFARYAELAGTDQVVIELPIHATVADAVALLRNDLPRGKEIPARPLAALNATHAQLGEELQDGDELALLPPLAGGRL